MQYVSYAKTRKQYKISHYDKLTFQMLILSCTVIYFSIYGSLNIAN